MSFCLFFENKMVTFLSGRVYKVFIFCLNLHLHIYISVASLPTFNKTLKKNPFGKEKFLNG